MCLFTLPIALYGLTAMPAGANPDMFVLTLPLAAGQEGLAQLNQEPSIIVEGAGAARCESGRHHITHRLS